MEEHSLWAGQILALNYLWAEIRRQKKSFVIGGFTVFLVVFVVSLLQNAVLQSPLVFFAVSEAQVGENDLVLTPGAGLEGRTSEMLPGYLINQTYVDLNTHIDLVTGTTARWMLVGRVLPNNATTIISGNQTQTLSASAIVLGVNSTKEKEIGLGRKWDYPPLTEQQCFISRSIVRQIGLDPMTSNGENVVLRFDLFDLARTLDMLPSADSSSAGSAADAMLLINTFFPNVSSVWDNSFNLSPFISDFNITDYINPTVIRRFLESNNITNLIQELNLTILNGTESFNFDPVTNTTTICYNTTTVSMSNISAALDALASSPYVVTDINWTEVEMLFTQLQDNITNAGENVSVWVADSNNMTNISYSNDILCFEFKNVTFNESLTWDQYVVDIGKILSYLGINESFNFNSTDLYVNGTLNQTEVNILFRELLLLITVNTTVSDVFTLIYPYLIQPLTQINSLLTIQGVVDEPEGKWPQSLGSVLMVEVDSLFNTLQGAMLQVLNPLTANVSTTIPVDIPLRDGGVIHIFIPISVNNDTSLSLANLLQLIGANPNNAQAIEDRLIQARENVETANPNSYTTTSVIQYRDRVAAYLADLRTMKNMMIAFTNQVALGVGVDYAVTYTLPMATSLEQTIYIRYFLDNIFGAVMALVVILGVLLIYALLLNDVQAKTYEYGMLRALGMTQRTLIQILLSKGIMFALIGIGFGLFLTFMVNIPIANLLAKFAALSPSYSLFASAVLLGFSLGLLMPIIANIVPISRALSKTLRDSLDIYHHLISDISVKITKLADLGLDLWQTAIALLMLIVGFVTFYLVPYAFTFKNIPMFLGILTAILLGMLLGLCILAQLVQPKIEFLLLKLLLLTPHWSLHDVVRKNLSGHRKRNIKTANMLTICLAFMLFAGSMFSLQANSLVDNLKMFLGADIVAWALTFSDQLDAQNIGNFLEQQKLATQKGLPGAVVEDYTLITYPLDSLRFLIDRAQFGNLVGYPNVRNFMYGVQENYLDVAYSDYWIVQEYDTSINYPKTAQGAPDAVKLMYTDKGNATLPEEKNGIVVPVPVSTGYTNNRLGISYLKETNNTNHTEHGMDEVRQKENTDAYTDYIDVIASYAHADFGSISLDVPLCLWIRGVHPNGTYTWKSFLGKARALVSKAPGFVFSSYRTTAPFAPLLMPMDDYQRILTLTIANESLTPSSPPIEKVFVRLKPHATREEREDVINGMRTFFKSDKTLAFDTQTMIDTTHRAVDMMNLFFLVVGVIAMVLCFFILWLSFTANVTENAWEFGVLRAVGLNSVQVVMIYVYEALAIVFTSLLLGTGIGLLISASLTLQFNLFTEMPFRMSFPTGLFLTLLFMSIGCAVLGSYLPARSFMKKSISDVIRRI